MKTEQNGPSTVNISSLWGSKNRTHHAYAEILSAEAPLKARRTVGQPRQIDTEPESLGYIYAERDLLCIEHMGKLQVSRCVKTNQEADRVVKINLRCPFRPETWWGKCPRRLTIGLTDAQYTRYHLQATFAKLGLLGSLATFWYGIMGEPIFCLVAVVGFVVTSIIHAITPVWYEEASREFTSVKGVSKEFLDRLNQTKAHHNPLPSFDMEEVAVPRR